MLQHGINTAQTLQKPSNEETLRIKHARRRGQRPEAQSSVRCSGRNRARRTRAAPAAAPQANAKRASIKIGLTKEIIRRIHSREVKRARNSSPEYGASALAFPDAK
jgi:hypothetical protein